MSQGDRPVRHCWLLVSLYFVLLLVRVYSGIEEENEAVDFLTQNNLLQGKAEVVFLLDRSGSVGSANFEIEKGFVESFLTHVVVDVNATRVAVISYSNTADRHIDYLRNPKNKCFLSEELQDVKYEDSEATNIAGALDEAYDVLRNARPSVNKVVILISDGLATRGGDPIASANKLKKENVQIFALGVGRFLMSQLKALATSPKHTYSCSGFREFNQLTRKIRGDPHESTWAGVSTTPSCSHLCDSPYAGQPDDPGCCDYAAKCSCALLSGMHTCVCKPGYYGLSGLLGNCEVCPEGTYKSRLEPAARCTPCPPQSTTRNVASTSIEDCFCKEGYIGNPSKGIPCTIVKCPPLQAPTHGMPFGECVPEFESECYFFCDEGYEFADQKSESRTCQSNGQWSSTPTICRKIRCPEPVNPQFGWKHCGDIELSVGSECSFHCVPGYDLIGSNKRTCHPNKKWSGVEAKCLARKCPLPPPLKYGHMSNCKSNEKPVVGQTCLYRCNYGFKLEGSHFLMCNENKELVDTVGQKKYPVCKDTEKPTIKCQPVMRKETSPGKPTALVYWEIPLATDNTGEKPELVTDPPGLSPPMKLSIGTHNILYKATDEAGLTSSCNVTIMVVDNEIPKVLECPSKMERNTTDRELAVFWKEPIFSDNSQKKLTIKKSHEPGHIFNLGRNYITYHARDPSGNVAKCKFEIDVKENECPYYPPPVNGAFACDDWMLGQFCQAYCEETYEFNFQPAEWYICNINAQWQTLPEGLPIPWPDCSSRYVPHRVRSMVKGFYYQGDCNDPKVQAAIKKVFLRHFRTKFQSPQFCSGKGACTIDNVIVRCGEIQHTNSRRRRRDTWDLEAEGVLEIDFEIIVNTDEEMASPEEFLKDLMETIEQLSWSAEDADETLTLDIQRDGGNQESKGKIVMTSSEAVLVCDPGSVLKDDKCVLCPSGSYFHNESSTCLDCPIGEYQEEEGQIECLSCPPGSSTEDIHCRNETDCKSLCKPGTYSATGLETCISCPVGTYQDEEEQTSCKICQNGTTTSSEGATNHSYCQAKCEPGTYSENGLQPCEPCHLGHYQSLEGQTECLECAGNLTTITYGMTSEENCIDYNPCTVVECQHGGTCVPLRHETLCLCKNGFQGKFCEEEVDECLSTPCLNDGVCVNFEGSFYCNCTAGFTGSICEEDIDECLSNPCHNNGVCVDKITSFTCMCQPGYSGVNCDEKVDPCSNEGLCLNGGICEVKDDTPLCKCLKGFTGQYCSENINDCEGISCKNGGSCVDGISTYSCTCAHGWTGKYCEVNIDDCQVHNCSEGSTCLDMIGGYTCLCLPGWSGSRCEIKLDSDFVLSFPEVPTVANMAKVSISNSLSEATVSMWVQTNDVTRSGTPLSYAALAHVGDNMDNALTFSDCSGLQIYVNNEPLQTDLQVADGKWHHLTFTWSSQDSGRWSLYKDGKLESQGQGLQAGNSIPGNGVLVLGQEQDDLGGGFSPFETFTGNITRVNVWSRVFSSHNVTQLCNLNDDLPGKVVAWPDFLGTVSGKVNILRNENPTLL